MTFAVPSHLPGLRAFVVARAIALGLAPERAELLKLAVSELATNTLLYNIGGGRVQVWTDGDGLLCEVVDRGPAPDLHRSMPPAEAERGRGLPIVQRICDEVSIGVVADGVAI